MIRVVTLLVLIIGFSGCAGCSQSGKRRLKMEKNGSPVSIRQEPPPSTQSPPPPPAPPEITPQQPKQNPPETRTSPPSTPRSSMSVRDIAKAAEPCVFLVFTQNKGGQVIGQGTGFFIDDKGIGVSNYHVFDKGSKWRIQTQDGRQYPVERILQRSEGFDFVTFQVKSNEPFPYLKTAPQTPEKGDEILVLGNPKGLESTLTKGIVSSIREQDYKDDLIQIDAAISPGSSGSPVLNMKAEVVGIATLKIVDCEQCNFAYNINVLDKVGGSRSGMAQ